MRTLLEIQRFLNQIFKWVASFGLVAFSANSISETAAYDNSRSPPFEAPKEGRVISRVSIHPDGEHWIFTEAVDKTGGVMTNIVWLFHLPTRKLRRYQLPEDHQYGYVRFSPSGRFVVMARYPNQRDGSEAEYRRVISEVELVMMNMDGSEFKVLSVPKGMLLMPVVSPDEKKVLYSISKKMRDPGERTLLTNFDIYEFDIESGKNYPYSRSLTFYSFHSIDYISNDEILIGAYGLLAGGSVPSHTPSIHASEVYYLKRGSEEGPRALFSMFKSANDPTVDAKGNIFFEAYVDNVGISIVRHSSEKSTSIWRLPKSVTDISDICVDPKGKYLAATYRFHVPYRSPSRTRGIGSVAVFDLKKQIWFDAFLHQPVVSQPIKVLPPKRSSAVNHLN